MSHVPGVVEAVGASPVHSFAKVERLKIRLVAGIGVEGDVHAGATVRHRFDARREPTRPNLRQVHLLAGELLDELGELGYHVAPGRIGENVTTRGIDLLGLPLGTRLRLGADAEVELTGLRVPCRQLEQVGVGLMATLLDRSGPGRARPRAGVMAVVRAGGDVTPGDEIAVALPPSPHVALPEV